MCIDLERICSRAPRNVAEQRAVWHSIEPTLTLKTCCCCDSSPLSSQLKHLAEGPWPIGLASFATRSSAKRLARPNRIGCLRFLVIEMANALARDLLAGRCGTPRDPSQARGVLWKGHCRGPGVSAIETDTSFLRHPHADDLVLPDRSECGTSSDRRTPPAVASFLFPLHSRGLAKDRHRWLTREGPPSVDWKSVATTFQEIHFYQPQPLIDRDQRCNRKKNTHTHNQQVHTRTNTPVLWFCVLIDRVSIKVIFFPSASDGRRVTKKKTANHPETAPIAVGEGLATTRAARADFVNVLHTSGPLATPINARTTE